MSLEFNGMIRKAYKNDSLHQSEPGAVRPYLIGFLLSLALTAIPYYLVVNKPIAGAALLAAIITFAVLQMTVQIIFFLHLGRGPKPIYNIAFFVATAATIILVVVGSIWIMSHLNYNMVNSDVSKYLAEKEGIYQIAGEETGACQGIGLKHTITISNSMTSPMQIEAKKCDSITFLNEDGKERKIRFGSPPQSGTYGGQYEVTLRPERGKNVILNQAGTYKYYDYLEPDVTGGFTVTQ